MSGLLGLLAVFAIIGLPIYLILKIVGWWNGR